MISYAQNGEDVLLDRAFGTQAAGCYVDIGAGHPWVDSVTYHFYAKGWRGLNVEPRPRIAGLLETWRPADKLAHCGVSDRDGQVDFFEVHAAGSLIGDGGGLSTFDLELAARYAQEGYEVTRHAMRLLTLVTLLTEHDIQEIDFLKIDVEGHEGQVILGGDWERWRPKVVVVEAIAPILHTDSTQAWRDHLVRHGYLEATFDGLNRYYVRIEDRHLVECLTRPLSVLDTFTTWQDHLHERYLEKKLGRRWRKIVATDRNVPDGLSANASSSRSTARQDGPMLGNNKPSFFQRLVSRS